MVTVDTSQAKNQLSALIERAAAGEEIVITRYGKPVARLTGVVERKEPRKGNLFTDEEMWIGDDFDDPYPPDIAKALGMDPE